MNEKHSSGISKGPLNDERLKRLRLRSDAQIQAGIAVDPDATPELDEAWFAAAGSLRRRTSKPAKTPA